MSTQMLLACGAGSRGPSGSAAGNKPEKAADPRRRRGRWAGLSLATNGLGVPGDDTARAPLVNLISWRHCGGTPHRRSVHRCDPRCHPLARRQLVAQHRKGLRATGAGTAGGGRPGGAKSDLLLRATQRCGGPRGQGQLLGRPKLWQPHAAGWRAGLSQNGLLRPVNTRSRGVADSMSAAEKKAAKTRIVTETSAWPSRPARVLLTRRSKRCHRPRARPSTTSVSSAAGGMSAKVTADRFAFH
jgi:hypothetical protein